MTLTEEELLILKKFGKTVRKTKAEERDDYIQAILQSTLYPSFKDTPKELAMAFSTVVEPDTTKSYFVYGANKDILYKFAAFFTINCNRNFNMYFVKELTEKLKSPSSYNGEDESMSFYNNNLLILYNHKHITAMGAQQDLYYSTVINRVVERNRRNLPTLVLSEIKEPRYEECGEFEVVNLGVLLSDKKYSPAPAAKVIQTKKSVVTNPSSSSYSIPESKTSPAYNSGIYGKKKDKREKNDYLQSYKNQKEQE